jgi:hypothetical protein
VAKSVTRKSRPQSRSAGKSRQEIATVYFGAERKMRIARHMKTLGFTSLSAYLSSLVDHLHALPADELRGKLKPPARKPRGGVVGRKPRARRRKSRQPVVSLPNLA